MPSRRTHRDDQLAHHVRAHLRRGEHHSLSGPCGSSRVSLWGLSALQWDRPCPGHLLPTAALQHAQNAGGHGAPAGQATAEAAVFRWIPDVGGGYRCLQLTDTHASCYREGSDACASGLEKKGQARGSNLNNSIDKGEQINYRIQCDALNGFLYPFLS